MDYSLVPGDFSSIRNRARLCYTLLTSPVFYHQDITALNPFPHDFDPAYVFPRDMTLLYYHKDYSSNVPSIEKILELMEKKHAPIFCAASHISSLDCSFHVIVSPEPINHAGEEILVHWLGEWSAEEKENIMKNLLRAYASYSDHE